MCRRRHGAADFANARRVFDAVERAVYEAVAPGPGDRFAAAHQYIWPLAFVPFILFLVLVIVGSSNAVNFTDGLDGLAIGCVLVSSAAFTVLTYISSHARFAEYLEIQKIPDAGELVIFCGSVVGHRSDFFGTTRIPQRCSWEMWVRSRWAGRLNSWP